MFRRKYSMKLADYPPKARGFVVLGQCNSAHWSLRELARFVEENDRRLLAQCQQGFIREAIPGEFPPFAVVGGTRIVVRWHKGQVLRTSIDPCALYLCWADEYDKTPISVTLEDWFHSIFEPQLLLAGEPDPRLAPREVQQARIAAYDMEEASYTAFDKSDHPAMRKLLRVWRKAIPLDEDGDEEAAA